MNKTAGKTQPSLGYVGVQGTCAKLGVNPDRAVSTRYTDPILLSDRVRVPLVNAPAATATMARITFFVAALTGLASAAVTLTRGPAATGPVADASVSSATLFFADGLPVVWWGEASAEPAAAANSLNSVAAYATYDRAAHNSTGFGQLWITTTQKVPSLDAMFAAGMLLCGSVDVQYGAATQR